MSKTQLRKLLATMTSAQMSDLIIDLYEARPQAKEYLDFFVNPDIDKRIERTRIAIAKEVMRVSRGRNRARISVVRRHIKSIASLQPGAEVVCELVAYTISLVSQASMRQYFKEATLVSFARLAGEITLYAATAGLFDMYLSRINQCINSLPEQRQFRKYLHTEIQSAIASINK